MRELIKRRQNILRLIKRHQEHLVSLDLAKRTHEEVFLWLVAHSKTLKKTESDILGLWYGFGSLYQKVTCESLGLALRGRQICMLLGDAFTWGRIARIRDQLILNFTTQMRIKMPSLVVSGIYYYHIEPKAPSRLVTRKSGLTKISPLKSCHENATSHALFTWPMRC